VRADERINGWMLLRFLGKGGSGEVWVAKNEADSEVALKILRQRKFTARFLDEIKLYRQLGNRPGILALVDSHIPDQADRRIAERPWLAMEIGTPVTGYLGDDPDLAAVVEAIKSYAETFAELAENRIYHRDIKPSNLYWYYSPGS
jgi:serine/threonine protein kinase